MRNGLVCTTLATLLWLVAGLAHANSGSAAEATRLKLYAQLAEHNLLQMMLVVPRGNAGITKSSESGLRIAGNTLCVDMTPLTDELDTREVRELPEEARRQPIAAGEFYAAVRFDPPRLAKAQDDVNSYRSDLAATFSRFATAKFVKKITVELAQTGRGCTPDVIAVPALHFLRRPPTQQRPVSAWLERLQRQDVILIGTISTADLRAGRAQRLAGQTPERVGAALAANSATGAIANKPSVVAYGALRIEAGSFKTCYVSSDDPLPALASWAMADSDKVKRWMNATPATPKAIADLDAVLAEFRKPQAQRDCTLLVADTRTLARVSHQLERERYRPTLYAETASGEQILAAYGFRSLDELRFARDIGLDSGEQLALLRSLDIDTRAAYDKAVQRYSWQFGATKPDVRTLAAFVRDEREAHSRGTTVKELRAERAKREQDKPRRVSALSGPKT
jgi:hypothetical protein